MPALFPGVHTDNIKLDCLYLARLWRIVCVDGVHTFQFTDHDVVLRFYIAGLLLDFTPVGGFNPTATTRRLGLDASDKEFSGPIDDEDGITFDLLRGHALDEAEVTEYLVDWRFSWIGAMRTDTFWIANVEFDNDTFRAELEGVGRWLKPKVGDVCGRSCRWDLGRDKFGNISLTSGCKFDVASVTFNQSIATIQEQRRRWTATGGGISEADDVFAFGRILWTGGNNQGRVSQCSRWVTASNQITIQAATPFDLTVGDTYQIEMGCAKDITTCQVKFNNEINYGGQLFVPGNDRIFQIPRH